MPPAHRDLPDDVTPPGHEPVKYVVGPGDLTRGELRRLLADAGAKAAELSNLSRDDLVSVAKARKLEGLEVSGTTWASRTSHRKITTNTDLSP